jgi:hypothetical protein
MKLDSAVFKQLSHSTNIALTSTKNENKNNINTKSILEIEFGRELEIRREENMLLCEKLDL